MIAGEELELIERRYLAARDAHDRLDVARAAGGAEVLGELEAIAADLSAEVRGLLDGITDAEASGLSPDDRRAVVRMRAGLDTADAYRLPVAPPAVDGPCDDPEAWRAAVDRGGDALRVRLEACYASTADALPVGDGTLNRLQILARLGTEPDPEARRALFLSLAPLWRVVDGDGGDRSPYRRLIREAAPMLRSATAPVSTNAAALGVTRDEVEAWALTALAAWRAAVVEPSRQLGEPPVEPWDWWWRAGTAHRILGPIPLYEVEAINRAVYASLGADPDGLGVQFDIRPRPGRAVVPVAFTTFGARPHRRDDGSWSPGRPYVMASCTDGGYGELAELIHETGHAVHIAGIRTRPAFADWPDADALTEALADLVAFDVAEPAWQRRWLSSRLEVPEPLAMRCQYAAVVLDAAWALFEVRLARDPAQRASDVWTDLTATWLGIAPHPEWSWWAMRGQLLQEPGYMANYAIGAVLTTCLRDAIRSVRGDWIAGDPGWYAWIRERIYRFGLERPSGEVVRRVLGRAPTADALLAEIARGARIA